MLTIGTPDQGEFLIAHSSFGTLVPSDAYMRRADVPSLVHVTAWREIIVWNNVDLLSFRPVETNVSIDLLSQTCPVSFTWMRLHNKYSWNLICNLC